MKAEHALEHIKSLKVLEGNPDSATTLLGEKVAATVISILTDSELCKGYLRELNSLVANRLDSSFVLSQKPEQYGKVFEVNLPISIPSEAVEGDVHLLKIFEEVLHAEEIRMGVNKDHVPELVGFTPHDYADMLVNADYIWNDASVEANTYAHGRFSHRIQHWIVKRAIQDGRADLSLLDEGFDLSKPGVVFKPLVLADVLYTTPNLTKPDYGKSLWIHAIDTDADDPQNLGGPTALTQYLLSSTSFDELPYLSRAVFCSQYQALYQAAEFLNATPDYVLKLYADCTAGRIGNTLNRLHG